MSGLLKFITCGSVDDGKSTLIGHLLYDAKLLYTDQEKELELESKVGSCDGAIDYSLLLDGLMAEREQGITIDVAYRYFNTEKRSFIVADTPGHEEYTRNMAVGASFADLAIILVDATKGVLTQTRRHARICALMGIRYFIFAINKMDLANYSEQRFHEIENQIDALQKELNLNQVIRIPVSATEGDNVTKPSVHMSWYTGPTILSYIETVDVEETTEEGCYVPIQRVCRPNHNFRGFQGKIESGSLAVGDLITTLPSAETGKVQRILIGMEEVQTAGKGRPVTLQLDREVDVSRGCVLTKDTTIPLSNRLTVTLLWMDDQVSATGKEYMIKAGTKEIAGVLTDIVYKIDINTGHHMAAAQIRKNEIACCTLLLQEPIAADRFTRHKALGELILIDRISHMTAACGVIDDTCTEHGERAFVKGTLKGRGDIFEEYYYGMESMTITKEKKSPQLYRPGDVIPVQGQTYQYPDDFDILIIRDSLAVRIRGQKIEDILPLHTYIYDHVPVVNGRGFAIHIDSQETFFQFLQAYKESGGHPDAALFSTWMDFDTYRHIRFHNDFDI
jgi:sulfate adenylyltransferase subunit 1